MGANSLIQWTDHTFNPWRGCHKISEGCKNCYAATFVQNRQGLQVWGQDAPRKIAALSTMKQPLKWNREAERDKVRRRVFCASLADVFEDYAGPSEADVAAQRSALWALIESTPHLLWLLLTKRAGMVCRLVPRAWLQSWPANVWPGFTAENQARFDERWADIKEVPAPVIFTSIEPQLGPVILPDDYLARGQRVWPFIGGESGPGARPFDLAWAESLIAQCQAAGVPVFMKQAGARPIYDFPPGEEGEPQERDDGSARFWTVGFIKDKKGGDPSEWPAQLRVREIPPAAQSAPR